VDRQLIGKGVWSPSTTCIRTIKVSPLRPTFQPEDGYRAGPTMKGYNTMLTKLRARADKESGFTLVELLIVIAILGILAGVVVFSVGGITDDGTTSACKTEASTVRTAQEAFYAKSTSPKAYAASAGALVTAKLLGGTPTYVTTTSVTPFTDYTLAWVAGKGCTGTP
jgi:prepilin-type N-terminal cleavage/methylation domain-containing protein